MVLNENGRGKEARDYYNRGMLLYSLDKYDEASKSFDRAKKWLEKCKDAPEIGAIFADILIAEGAALDSSAKCLEKCKDAPGVIPEISSNTRFHDAISCFSDATPFRQLYQETVSDLSVKLERQTVKLKSWEYNN
jgi:tetratricopeptide (TPR) repeat protein